MQLMRNSLFLFISAAILTFSVSGCKPEKELKMGPRASQLDGIAGTWVLVKTQQIDVNVQLAFVESDTLLDISDVLIDGNPMEITFDKTTFNYTIKSGACSDMFNAASGTWKFDDVNYPSQVIFNQGTSPEKTLFLKHSIRPQDPYLILKANKLCGGNRTVSYHLWFTRK